ncbi:Beta-glucan synthesis-associated protein SKN1 [Phytophthora citrophthora]|uniref:Beta-glucan synthesis-associated protein SKN1 n=1 Tax=Phytophthora citrophthora TaxID=4793 RepID=A0AAD9LHL6_9STRA|nr:Beta-glucan synthesis-associated protein SKN1 [Phytophthora citrophthora]
MPMSWLRSSLLIGTAAFAVVDASGSASYSSSGSGSSTVTDRSLVKLETRSGIRPWVDPDTPDDVRTYVTSRGDTWELIMSDEFGDVTRNFSAGADHLWTSLNMPDGTNDALQRYSHEMTSVECDDDEEGLCYMQIKSIDEVSNITVWNNYLRPPGYQNSTFVRALVATVEPLVVIH